jgi:hypothetical protein
MEFPSDAVSFDPDKFDELIRTQGVDMVHYRAMPCPVGMIDADDVRHPNDHHENCSNGFVYKCAGRVICSFISNSKESRQLDLGRMDGSTVTVTFPRFYEKEREGAPDVRVMPCPFDRVYLSDEKIDVPTWERFNVSETGVDKLRFPIVCLIDIMDSNGVSYSQGTDFIVAGGKIQWLNGGPGIDPVTKKGRVCSVRYTYRPFWYVQRMVHEIRVAQVENEWTGDRETMRFPQQMVLQRELVFENVQRDQKAKETPRTARAPNDSDYVPSLDDLGTR